MRSKVRYVDLDVHKQTIVIAVAESGRRLSGDAATNRP